VIREINYVTVNGLVLTEGVHYVLERTREQLELARGPVRKNPSLTTTVLVSYYAGPLKTNAVRIAPVVNSYSKQICR
jgi:hypothetical protein